MPAFTQFVLRGTKLNTPGDNPFKWDTVRPFDGMSQRERLLAELNYMEKLRGSRRRHEVVPHRAQLNLFMGGKKIEMEERFDIQREINKLKALVLPQHAKDLYLGRGIHLPLNHASVKPRVPLSVLDSDSDEDGTLSAPGHMMRSHFLDMTPMKRQSSQLPHSSSLSLNPRRVIPGIITRFDPGLKHEMPVKSRTKLPSVDGRRDPASWVADQNKMMKDRNLSRVDSKDRVEIHMPENRRLQPSHSDDTVAELKPVTETETSKVNLETRTPNAPPSSATEFRMNGRQSSSPVKPVNLHPLKGSELVTSVPETEKDELRQTFQRLDTDMDGHLKFSQLKSQLPDDFSQTQERFLKQVYDITSTSTTMFGVDEFLTMTQLTKTVGNLSGEAQAAYQYLEFETLENKIRKFLELFQSVDRTNRGKISCESLREVLSTVMEKDFVAEGEKWQTILNTMSLENNSQVSKIEFLAHLPYFIALQKKV